MGFKLTDGFKGQWRSLRNGTGASFSATFNEVMNVKREREAEERAEKAAEKRRNNERNFGTGEIGGDPRNWEAPVHATTVEGQPVTVAFGKGPRAGHTLICDGHVDMATFYERRRDGLKGHDHYLPNGDHAGGVDRGNYSG